MRHLLNLFAVCAVALLSGMACATETDQFTLPPKPLDDLGPDLGAMVLAVLHSELSQLNAGIDQRMQFDTKVASEPIKEREFFTHIFE